MVPAPEITGIDHVELYVSDWEAAAAWYGRVLGCTREPSFEQWWDTRSGPMVLTVAGTTKLALFERDEVTRGDGTSPNQIAFQTTADGFLDFVDRLDELELTDREGSPVTADDVVDHDLSYSIYFTDLDGNWLELTTNEYDAVAAQLR